MSLRLEEVLSMLRIGQPVSDEDFDRIYPEWVRRASGTHWTPIEVARRAVHLLGVDNRTRVLDVGSGAGKFCLVGSLTSPGRFVGVEQRPRLVAAAARAARSGRVERVQFIHGEALAIDWRDFDVFYLYGPFYEQVFDIQPAIEEPITRSEQRYHACIAETIEKLSSARAGTRVVTVNGFGARPAGYCQVASERMGQHLVQLWRKDDGPTALTGSADRLAQE
jgi:SAM-dependent methyltransferase